MLQTSNLIIPQWPAPSRVKAFFTTRSGGVSDHYYASLNLGAHVGDDAQKVAENRRRLRELLPCEPVWLNQVHGTNIIAADLLPPSPVLTAPVMADGSVTTQAGVPCVVLVADCLPVLFCTEDGSTVGAAHAGWRGLCNGVLENTVTAMDANPAKVVAWLGPAIGPAAFEVGQDVFDAFTHVSSADSIAFQAIAGRRGKYLADIYALARRRLRDVGVQQIFGGEFCTVSEPARFFSFRRDGKTGRMAALVWLESGNTG